MAAEIITKEDLQQFRQELLKDVKDLLMPTIGKTIKEWLKGNEVRKLLSISSGTLQNLRITGKLHSSKIGGIHYYRYDDIQKLLKENFSASLKS